MGSLPGDDGDTRYWVGDATNWTVNNCAGSESANGEDTSPGETVDTQRSRSGVTWVRGYLGPVSSEL